MIESLLSQETSLSKILNMGQRVMFVFSIIALPFWHMPFNLPITGGDLLHFCLYLGLLLCLIKQYLFPRILTEFEKRGLLLILSIFLWNSICSILGVWDYPYYNMVDLMQMDKFKSLYDTLNLSKYGINDLTAIKFWLSVRTLRTSFFNIINTYAISVWIYLLYYDSEKELKSDIKIGVITLLVLMSLYSVFETGYLLGNIQCENLLRKINPLYIKVADTHGWWPPLLWKRQLRSLFLEPSFLGISAAFLFPVICNSFFCKKSLINTVLMYSLILMIFLTKARTATLLFIGELGLLGILVILFSDKKNLKVFFMIVLSTLVMLMFSLFFISKFSTGKNDEKNQDIEISEYIEENVLSVSGNKRSNSARYGNVHATFLAGLKHPLFGVGKGMQTTYIKNNFNDNCEC